MKTAIAISKINPRAMYGQTQITITQVSNGWVVHTPFIPQSNGFDDEFHIRRQARIMQDEIQGDKLLKELQQQDSQEETEKEPEIKTVPLKELKDPSIAVFKTFPEVLEYLSEKMKQQ